MSDEHITRHAMAEDPACSVQTEDGGEWAKRCRGWVADAIDITQDVLRIALDHDRLDVAEDAVDILRSAVAIVRRLEGGE